MARVRKKCIWESKKNSRWNKLLIYYDPKKPSLLAFDASLYGVWAVLSHWMPDGSEKPITFSSRTLSKAEHNYSQIEKEALTIVYPVKKFHSNLFRKHFYHILTISHFWDCYQNKKGLSMAAAHIQCWAILLFAYNYSLKYCSGSENLIAKFFGHFPSNEKYSFSSVKNKVFRENSSMPQLHLKKLGKFQKETLSFQMLLILFYVGGLLKWTNNSNHIFAIEMN